MTEDPQAARRATHVAPRYAELHAHTAFSFLDGASQPEELAAEAASEATAAAEATSEGDAPAEA